MASPFQRYQSGIQPVTGMLETGAAIGKMYQQGIAGIGEAIGQGIKIYGENQQKSEAADAKIAAGIARFKQISDIYAQDPEFAPVVAQFAERMAQYQKAPSESLSKKLIAANEIDVLTNDLGQSLQAQQMVRARQVERVGTEALDMFKDVKTVTDPQFIKEGVLKFNTGQSFDQNQGVFTTGLKNFRDAARAAGKELGGTDAEAIESYRRNVTDSVNKAMTAGTLDKAVGQRIIEQVEAARKLDSQSQAAKEALPDFGITAAPRSSKAAYDVVTGTAYQPPKKETTAESETEARIRATIEPFRQDAQAALESLKAQKKALEAKASEEERLKVVKGGKTPFENTVDNIINNIVNPVGRAAIQKYSKVEDGQVTVDWGKLLRDSDALMNPAILGQFGFILKQRGAFDADKSDVEKTKIAEAAIKAMPSAGTRSQIEDVNKQISRTEETLKAMGTSLQKPAEKEAPAPVVSLGRQVAGTIETEKKMSIAERKSKVADFMTARIGMTDPVTGKKVLPAGFNAWFSKAVPESEARVVNVDGVQLLWDGQKFTQIQAAKAPTMKEIRENLIGVYGTQDESGRLVATEFIPDSGVYLGGIFTGSDAADTKFREDMGNLIDARGSVRRLQEINDKFGESLSLRDAGIAEVDVMNLKAALRRDIVGVGQVSNYEQTLIDRVIKNPTDFLSLEPKDRAILLALAERIDRKIANNAAQYGLRAEIRGTEGGSRYQSLRQKYLAEKLK